MVNINYTQWQFWIVDYESENPENNWTKKFESVVEYLKWPNYKHKPGFIVEGDITGEIMNSVFPYD